MLVIVSFKIVVLWRRRRRRRRCRQRQADVAAQVFTFEPQTFKIVLSNDARGVGF